MERSEITRRVNSVLVEEFEVEEEKLVPEATLYEELEFDSLDSVDLIAALEREFAMKIDRQDAEKRVREIRTLGDVVDFVAETLGT